MTMLAINRIVFNTFLVLFIIAFLFALVSLYFQLREMRRDAAQGNLVRWYKRSPLLLNIALLLLIISEFINMAMGVGILSHSLLLYILLALLVVAGFSLIIYAFKLSWRRIKSRL